MVWPPLTTIRQPTRDLGWHAADLLLGGAGDRHRELPTELVERASTLSRCAGEGQPPKAAG